MATEGTFIRKASGLVRTVPPIDAWIYNCLTMGWLSVVAYNIAFNPFAFPGGNQSLAILMTAAIGTSMWTTYMFIVSALPRSGVDWIAQSRFLSPWIAFPIVIGDFWYLIYWDVWAYWFATNLGMNPFFVVAGEAWKNTAFLEFGKWVVTPKGYFLIGIIFLFLMGWQLSLPIKLFASIQRYLMYAATIGMAAYIIVFLGINPTSFAQNFNGFAARFVSDPDFYHTIIDSAIQGGYNPNPGFNWYDQIGLMAMIWSLLGWAFWSAQLSGEIKSAGNLRTQNLIMNGSGWATAIAWLVVWLVFSNAVDPTFIKCAGAAAYSGLWTLPISSLNLGMYIAASDARLGAGVMAALFIIMIGLVANAYQVYYNTMVGPIRMFFAMAFDRGLPDKFTIVHSRWHTPVYVIWLACACAVIQIYLSAYLPEVAPVFLPAALSSGCIPYTFTSLAGALMPWRGKAIYEASPAAKYRVGPIPLVTITGLISVVFNITMIYYWLTNPALGINPASMVFVFFFYILGFVWFIYWRWHRKRQGIDLSLSFKLVPPD